MPTALTYSPLPAFFKLRNSSAVCNLCTAGAPATVVLCLPGPDESNNQLAPAGAPPHGCSVASAPKLHELVLVQIPSNTLSSYKPRQPRMRNTYHNKSTLPRRRWKHNHGSSCWEHTTTMQCPVVPSSRYAIKRVGLRGCHFLVHRGALLA